MMLNDKADDKVWVQVEVDNMNKLIAILLCTIFLMSGTCFATDMGVTPDKAIHFGVAKETTIAAEKLLHFEWWQSLALIAVLSVVKEQIDVAASGSKDSWSNADIAANMAGWTSAQIQLRIEL